MWAILRNSIRRSPSCLWSLKFTGDRGRLLSHKDFGHTFFCMSLCLCTEKNLSTLRFQWWVSAKKLNCMCMRWRLDGISMLYRFCSCISNIASFSHTAFKRVHTKFNSSVLATLLVNSTMIIYWLNSENVLWNSV